MALIPEASVILHEQIAQRFIESPLGKNITLVYQPLQSKCPNCYGGNVYNGTGLISFDTGSVCPFCNGLDFIISEQTEVVRMMVYFDPREWINYQDFSAANVADGMVQTRGLMSLWPKVERCNYAQIHNDIAGLGFMKYEKFGKMIPFGARARTEFLQFWKLST